MRRKLVLLAVFITAALGLLSLWLVQKPNEVRTPLHLQLGPDFKAAYSWTYQSRGHGQSDIKSKELNFTLPRTELELLMKGRLYLRYLGRKEDTTILEMHVAPSEWTYRMDAAQKPKPESEFSGWLKIRDDGTISGFQFAELQYDDYAFIVADILSLLEFTLPETSMRSWTGVSQGFQGELPVAYTLEREETQKLELKKSYQSAAKTKAQGSVAMTISKQGLWETVKGQRQRWLKDKSGSQSEDTSSIELQKIAENWERPVPEVQKLSTHETLRGTTYSEKVQRNLFESDLRGRGWTEIQALIDALPETNPEQHVASYVAIRAFIALHGDQIAALKDYLSFDYKDPRCSVVAAALTAVSSREAQGLLMEAFDAAEGRPEHQEKLIAHLGLSERLGSAGEQKLYEVAAQNPVKRVQRAAELGIGIFGFHQQSQGQTAAMKRSLDFALGKLDSAQDTSEKSHALRILANIGAPSQIAAIEPYLNSADEQLKSEAIQALGRVDDPHAHRLLLGVLQSTSPDPLRELSVQSLSEAAQSREVYDSLSTQLARETSIPVVKRIVSHLARMHDNFPEVTQVLETYRENCGQTELRGFISSTLIAIK
jgi:hypothetical protein